MITVKEENNGTVTIDWDPEDPQEFMLNEWTEEDFINAIREGLTNQNDKE